MRLASTLPAGVSALLFDSARQLRRLESRLVAELELSGFGEAVLPVVDFLEPYEPVLEAATRNELYRFADRSGAMLALRADFTPLLARLLAPHLATLTLPLRIFYRGDVVRAPAGNGRGARGGSLRSDGEQYQLGGEIVGAPAAGMLVEREAALCCARLLSLATGGRGSLVLGFAGVLDDLLVTASGSSGAAELARSVARRERAAARTGGVALLEVVEKGAPTNARDLGESGAAALASLEQLREAIAIAVPGLDVGVDLAEFADFSSLVSGQASYYGGVVFRGYLPGIARPVATGGRYDELFRRLGAADVSAAGFSLRLDELAIAAGVAA